MANDLTAFKAEVFSSKVVERLDQKNVMLSHVNMDWTGDVSRGIGSVVHVRTLGDVTIRDYAVNDTITYENLAPSTESFTVDSGKMFAFKVDDIEQAMSDMDVLDVYAERAAVALNNTVEAKILSVYGSAHADNKITGASAAAIALDSTNIYANFVEAGKRLDDKNVPSTDRVAIIDSKTKALIAQSPALVRSTTMGDATVRGLGNGVNYVGEIAGFQTYWSGAVPSDANAKYLMFLDNKAIAYAAILREVEKIRLESTFGTALRGLLVHGVFVSAEASKRIVTIKAVK